jgi:hypothetical protein
MFGRLPRSVRRTMPIRGLLTRPLSAGSARSTSNGPDVIASGPFDVKGRR